MKQSIHINIFFTIFFYKIYIILIKWKFRLKKKKKKKKKKKLI